MDQIPPVTKALLGGVALVTGSTILGLKSPASYYLNESLLKAPYYQVWRLATSFLWAGSGLSALFMSVMLFQTSKDLETQLLGRSSDYAYAILLIASSLAAVNLPLNTPFLFNPLLIALTHVWGQYSAGNVNFYGIISIPAKYAGIALVVLGLLNNQGGPPPIVAELTGLAIGHLYYYLRSQFPTAYNGGRQLRFMQTPLWLSRLFNESPRSGGGAGTAGSSTSTTRSTPGSSWSSWVSRIPLLNRLHPSGSRVVGRGSSGGREPLAGRPVNPAYQRTQSQRSGYTTGASSQPRTLGSTSNLAMRSSCGPAFKRE